jgi:hypothetical protein
MNPKITRIAATVAVLLVGGLLASGCGQSNAQKQQQAIVGQDVFGMNQQLRRLRDNEKLPTFNDSAALHVQDAYYTADADPNKTWYVTLVALDGTPYAHFTTRGAPQPAGDQVTNPQQLQCQHNGGNVPDGCGTIGLPEPNGVHQGTGNEGYVAILTTGAMIRIPAGAVISDQPFKVDTPIRLSIDESASISATDESKTTNAVIPKGSGKRAK